MKIPQIIALAATCACIAGGDASAQVTYTNFIRQVLLPDGVQWDASVAPQGEQLSALPLTTAGSRFELWTVKNSPLTSYLLDTKFVSTFSPSAEIVIHTEDPYSVVPRTRCDRPFSVDVTVNGLQTGPDVPDSGKSAKLFHHVQSYGLVGTDADLNRSQATLLNQSAITSNGTITLNYAMTSVPAADLTKATGEERFSVFSVKDNGTGNADAQLASRYLQIWPMADATIAGIASGDKIRFKMPQLTLTLNDLYPESDTYLQVYHGPSQLGVQGTRLTGIVRSDSTPISKVLVLKDYDSNFLSDGEWTMEILTTTPFGTDRLASVTFHLDRTLKINTMLTTSD